MRTVTRQRSGLQTDSSRFRKDESTFHQKEGQLEEVTYVRGNREKMKISNRKGGRSQNTSNMAVKVKETSLNMGAIFMSHTFQISESSLLTEDKSFVSLSSHVSSGYCHILVPSCLSLVKINQRSPFMSLLSGSFQMSAAKGGICPRQDVFSESPTIV